MNKYLKLTLIFIGIWFVASGINGLLGTICIAVFDGQSRDGNMLLALVCSFIFSIPFVFIIWLSGMLSIAAIKGYDRFYRLILYESFILSIVVAILFKGLFNEFHDASLFLCVSTVVSAVTTIILFRNELKKINID